MADVAATIDQWSTTASSNTPADNTSVGSGLGDNIRTIQAVVRAYLAHYNSVSIASGGTTDLGANAGLFQEISGTTTITALGSISAGVWKIVRFQGALTLTHNATSLIIPGGASITTAAGDIMLAYSRGSGNWTVPFFQRANGTCAVFINEQTAETAPAVADTIAIYDASASANRKMTLENMLKVINSLTADASPVATTDYWVMYDASASAAKRVLPSSLAATTSAPGISEYATNAEYAAGSSTTRTATPASAASCITVTGGETTVVHPGGLLIEKFGVFAYTDANETYTFQVAFPTDCEGIACGYNSANTLHTGVRVTAKSASAFTVVVNPGSGGNATIYFHAWGS